MPVLSACVRAASVVVIAALATPAIVRAQAAPELRAGRWAAEAAIGPDGESGSLLRFSSPTSALLVGLSFDFSRATEEQEITGPFPGDDTEETITNAGLALRLGFRNYAAPGAALRPISGVGLLAGGRRVEQTGQTLSVYSTGVYGELGAVYLFSSRVSLGAAGELRATYDATRLENANVERRSNGFGIGGSVARVMGTVYF